MKKLMSEEIDRKFEKMLRCDDSVGRFMLCTPFTTDDVLKYGGDLTEDLFYEKLYIQAQEDIEKQIVKYIKQHNKNTIYVLGNKGCGKSTFVNKIKRTLKGEQDVCCEFIDFGESNSSLKYEKAKETMVRKIYKLLKKQIVEDSANKVLNEYIHFYFNNKAEIDNDWDLNKKIDIFFKVLQSIIIDQYNKLERLETSVRLNLIDMELFQLFFVFTLLLIHIQLGYYGCLKPTAVILDNLDNMLEITEIKKFVEHYQNYLQAIGAFINRCNLNGDAEHKYQVVYVLVMREITKASISTPHSLELTRVTAEEYDVTELYSKKEISCRRTEYLMELIKQMEQEPEWEDDDFQTDGLKIKSQALDIQNVVSDSYIQKTIYPLFNNDYRIVTMSLVRICNNNSLLLSEYVDLMNCGIQGAKYGGRGIIYRLILNRFGELNYFKKIGIVNFGARNDKKVSLNRLILTYLNNTTDIKATGDSKSISLKEIFKSFKQFKTKEIVDCVWEMYNLISTEEWNPLITYVSSSDVSKNGLYKEKEHYEKWSERDELLDTDDKYSFFRITCAGRVYLTNICPHFEFFACRIFGAKRPPLFSKKAFVVRNDKPIYKEIISSVFEQVKLCCESLQEFENNRGLYSKIDSDFNFKNEAGTYQYHSERIIFSHISYIEIYRCYLLERRPNEVEVDIEATSLFIIEIIEKYINLFDEYRIGCSLKNKEGKYIKDVMREKIKEAYRKPLNPEYTINIQEDA